MKRLACCSVDSVGWKLRLSSSGPSKLKSIAERLEQNRRAGIKLQTPDELRLTGVCLRQSGNSVYPMQSPVNGHPVVAFSKGDVKLGKQWETDALLSSAVRMRTDKMEDSSDSVLSDHLTLRRSEFHKADGDFLRTATRVTDNVYGVAASVECHVWTGEWQLLEAESVAPYLQRRHLRFSSDSEYRMLLQQLYSVIQQHAGMPLVFTQVLNEGKYERLVQMPTRMSPRAMFH